MADRAVRLWPGPGRHAARQQDITLLSSLRQVLAALPAGTWTSYGDLAELIGSHIVPIGSTIAGSNVPHAWRVLRSDGSVPPGFGWQHVQRNGDPRDVLSAEGVEFGPDGRANPAQRLSADELADLLGLAVDEPITEEGPVPVGEESFRSLLAEHQPPEVVCAVRELMACWRRLGGRFGSGPPRRPRGRRRRIASSCRRAPTGVAPSDWRAYATDWGQRSTVLPLVPLVLIGQV